MHLKIEGILLTCVISNQNFQASKNRRLLSSELELVAKIQNLQSKFNFFDLVG